VCREQFQVLFKPGQAKIIEHILSLLCVTVVLISFPVTVEPGEEGEDRPGPSLLMRMAHAFKAFLKLRYYAHVVKFLTPSTHKP
jgi:hypothetical protein